MQKGMSAAVDAAAASGSSVEQALRQSAQEHADGLAGAAAEMADRFKATLTDLRGDMSAAAEDTNAKGTAVRKAMLQAMQLHADSLTTAAAAATDRFKAAIADMQAGMDNAAASATAKGTSVQDALLGAVQLHADGLSSAATTIVDRVRDSIGAL